MCVRIADWCWTGIIMPRKTSLPKLWKVPWGTREPLRRVGQETLGDRGPLLFALQGRAASRLGEPRTPRALAGGVSALQSKEDRGNNHARSEAGRTSRTQARDRASANQHSA